MGVATLAAVVGGLVWAWQLRWVCDDAFISFRYAHHLVEGNGLVFNPGERVEGYTNFLWTILIAGGLFLGIDASLMSVVLSMASLAGLLSLSAWLAHRLSGGRPAVFLPFAAIALAGNYVISSYGTSGLETMFAALLVLVAVERAEARSPLLSGLAGILATMSHPDHAVFYAAMAGAMLMRRELRPSIVRYALPFVFLYVPYFLWRYSYYGDVFPNTYYAKSGGLAYFHQGGRYLLINFLSAGLFAVVPLMLYGLFRYRSTLLARFVFIALPLYLVYVAKIGGDFMLGRLMCPILAPVFILAELGAREAAVRGRLVGTSLGLAVFGLAAVPTTVIREYEKYAHVADERTFYRVASLWPTKVQSMYANWADELNRHFVDAGVTPRVGIGCCGIVGYETKLPIVDTWALNHYEIAHREITRRGRPGHEKRGTPADLLEGDVHFADSRAFPKFYDSWIRMKVGRTTYYLAKYDREIMKTVAKDPKVRFRDFEAHMDRFNFARRRPEARRWCDAWLMEQFYFKHNNDPARLRSLRAKLVMALPKLAGAEDFLLLAPSRDSDWEPVSRLGFGDEQAATWTTSGEAFAGHPVSSNQTGQSVVHGASGVFANSFHPKIGDHAKGVLQSEPFEIVGDVMTLRVGGGMEPKGAYVQLRIGDDVLYSATGCETELMGRRVWNTASVRGQTAVIEVQDASEKPWGHITVDDIVQWRRGG